MVGEVAITVALVLIGSQLLGSFLDLIRTDPGFQASRVLASVVLPASQRYPTLEQRADTYRKFLDAVRAIPGVESAGTVDALPFSGENHGGFVSASKSTPTGKHSQVIAEINVVGGEYLQTLGVRLVAGHWFRQKDRKESGDTTIVNDITANKLWPGRDAVGQQLCVNCTPENPRNWKRVIGVISTIRHASLDGPLPVNVYWQQEP